MKKTFNVLTIIALALVIIGALNWLLIGVFDFNFVNWVTFGVMWLERLLYILVGVAGIYSLCWLVASNCAMCDCDCDDEKRTNTY